jgi:Raf kinase inhibitor-like YbhB/YbcL family protein
VHWIVYNIPKDANGLDEAIGPESMPPGAHEALSDWMRAGYGGPCPPIGRHRYIFRLHALDRILPDLKRARKSAIDRAIDGHVLGTAELIGTYRKHGQSRAEPGASRFGDHRNMAAR